MPCRRRSLTCRRLACRHAVSRDHRLPNLKLQWPAASADTPSDEAPPGRARTAIYRRMMANDRPTPPPPPLTRSVTSDMRRSWSEEALLDQGQQPVGRGPTHRRSSGGIVGLCGERARGGQQVWRGGHRQGESAAACWVFGAGSYRETFAVRKQFRSHAVGNVWHEAIVSV